MSANSPTYDCPHDTTIPAVVNTTQPYCIVPGGAPRLDICCTNLFQSSQPQLLDPCFAWCDISLSNAGSNSQQAQLQSAAQSFAYCLAHGDNATYLPQDNNGGLEVICRYDGPSNLGVLGDVNLTATPTAEGAPDTAVTGSATGSSSSTPNVGVREMTVDGIGMKGVMVWGLLMFGGMLMGLRG